MSKTLSLRLSDDLYDRIVRLKGDSTWPAWLQADSRIQATYEKVPDEDMEAYYQLRPHKRPGYVDTAE